MALAEVTHALMRQPAGRPGLTARWRSWSRRVALSDLAVVCAATGFGLGFDIEQLGWDAARYDEPVVRLTAGAVVLGWMWALAGFGTRDRRIAGVGPLEYTRVVNASWVTFAVLAVLSYLIKQNTPRSAVAVAFPIGLGLLLLVRYAWRRRLERNRLSGRLLVDVLLAGPLDSVLDLLKRLERRACCGYRAVAACLPEHERPASGQIRGVPVVGDLGRTTEAAAEAGADAVLVAGGEAANADYVRRLGWALNRKRIDLVVASALTDVAGPRILVAPVAGARLIHVTAPTFTGRKYLVKTAFDGVCAALLVAFLSPVFAAVALAVARTSPGPVIYRQQRVGKDGEPFTMYKFRSMVDGAHALVDGLTATDDGNGLLFKMRDDPRVTPVGRFIRRTSLDELPQLWNVLKGDMSLVGPRPPLPEEVARYDSKIMRRLLVKPGITGLWQVSGRSDLSLEDSVRLDLSYVENWTLMGDIGILLQTVRAVAAPRGAY